MYVCFGCGWIETLDVLIITGSSTGGPDYSNLKDGMAKMTSKVCESSFTISTEPRSMHVILICLCVCWW